MEIKHYKIVSNMIAFILGAFTLGDILDYFFYTNVIYGNNTSLIIAQGFFIAGLISIFVLFALILQNIKKRGVFISRNEKLFRYFGIIILVLGVISDVLHKNITDVHTSAPRVLGLLGGTLIFISFIFKIGIKMQEEQNLTI
ncbi:MAG: hypothetical protein ACOYEG_07165 [Petrimonas sp.]|jgi:uncharacterized membrane protein